MAAADGTLRYDKAKPVSSTNSTPENTVKPSFQTQTFCGPPEAPTFIKANFTLPIPSPFTLSF